MRRTARSKKKSSLIATALAFALACIVTALISCGAPPPAFAASGTGTLTIGRDIEYGSNYTCWMSFDGTTAYCVEPSKYTPTASSYGWTSDIDASQPGPFYRYLYYGYGGPGFSRDDPAWPRTSWDGSPMTDDDYYLCTHLLLADAYASDGMSSLFGLSAGARYWYAWNILGFGVNVGRDDDNTNSTGWQFKSRSLPGTQASLSGPDAPTRWDPGQRRQISGSLLFSSDSDAASFSFALPAHVTLHNDTTGAAVSEGTATIRVGERFHFTAPPSVGGAWDCTGAAVEGLRDFTPVRISSGSDRLQECTSWKAGYEEVTRSVSFRIAWLPFGDLELVKTAESPDQVTPPLSGIGFTLTNEATGEQVALVTDADGRASTADLEREAFPRGRLTEGTWTVAETSGTPAGFYPLDPHPVTVSAAASPVRVVFENKHITGAVRVVKVDAETGERIALGGEDGASFEVKRLDGTTGTYEAIEWQLTYPAVERTTVLSTAADGTLGLPEPLDAGAYRLVEVAAPRGYVLGEPIAVDFVVDEHRDWSSPLEVVVENTPVKGVIRLEKSDGETGAALAGGRFALAAAEDIATPDGTVRAAAREPVGELVTGEDGTATSSELYPGRYLVRETAPPPGYAIDEAEHEVVIEAGDGTAPLVEVGLALVDAPTKMQILKVSGTTYEPLAGATFRIEREPEAADPVPAPLATERTTDAQGLIELVRLAPGTYTVREVGAPVGFELDGTAWQFTVDGRGLVDEQGTRLFRVEDAPVPQPLATTGDEVAPAAAAAGALVLGSIAFAGVSLIRCRLHRVTKRAVQ